MNILAKGWQWIRAKFHVHVKCPFCPKSVRKTRDVLNEGECFWYSNWKKKKNNIITYQKYLELKKQRKVSKKDMFV